MRIRIRRYGARRLIGEKQFDYQRAGFFGTRAFCCHHHSIRREPTTGGRQNTFPRYFNHAGAAIAVRAIRMRIAMAQMRNVDFRALGRLPDRFAVTRLDFLPVKREADDPTHGVT
jgi:hypothetical protein